MKLISDNTRNPESDLYNFRDDLLDSLKAAANGGDLKTISDDLLTKIESYLLIMLQKNEIQPFWDGYTNGHYEGYKSAVNHILKKIDGK